MKFRIYIILFLAICYSILANSQETIISIENKNLLTDPKDNVYYKDVNNLIDKYVDTWVFDDGIHYLKVEITKKTKELKGYGWETTTIYEDLLYMKYQYKLNGNEVYNTILNDDLIIDGNLVKSDNEIVLFYKEPSLTSCNRTKSGRLSLKFVPSTIPNPNLLANDDATLIWRRRYSATSRLKCADGTDEDDSDFLIPTDLTLHRE
jgi:hypothetical protein